MTRMLTKIAMERALAIEMEEHLGEKGKGFVLPEIPRDRDSTFEPQLVNKSLYLALASDSEASRALDR